MRKIFKSYWISSLTIIMIVLITACSSESNANIMADDTNQVEAETVNVEEQNTLDSVEEPTEALETKSEQTDGSFENVLAQMDRVEVESVVLAKSAEDWADDYEMQDYQHENEMIAFDSLVNLVIDTEYKETILSKAVNDWPNQYEMMKYQYDNQLVAYNRIQELIVDTDVKKQVLEKAQSDWGNDYEMVQYQYEKQMEAYNN
ncbi:hypothetical protein [Aquibacillus rhizosphaerae]|uniref:Uncharacterized protein n=1 Tax=Aquibacillus rhizosphaerae TaxID=3051431 RepID=A0ABT7L9Y4_9BACI|nr:hypothetical protein [Aquibacillus sp. LR5S19]MDL4842681.1 hypothetical protein [Aquibacillus sp. LR5S19]